MVNNADPKQTINKTAFQVNQADNSIKCQAFIFSELDTSQCRLLQLLLHNVAFKGLDSADV